MHEGAWGLEEGTQFGKHWGSTFKSAAKHSGQQPACGCCWFGQHCRIQGVCATHWTPGVCAPATGTCPGRGHGHVLASTGGMRMHVTAPYGRVSRSCSQYSLVMAGHQGLPNLQRQLTSWSGPRNWFQACILFTGIAGHSQPEGWRGCGVSGRHAMTEAQCTRTQQVCVYVYVGLGARKGRGATSAWSVCLPVLVGAHMCTHACTSLCTLRIVQALTYQRKQRLFSSGTVHQPKQRQCMPQCVNSLPVADVNCCKNLTMNQPRQAWLGSTGAWCVLW